MDQVFFGHMGLDCVTLDVSDFEGAEIIHGL